MGKMRDVKGYKTSFMLEMFNYVNKFFFIASANLNCGFLSLVMMH